ncbi:protein kinase domain-containing protein [Priestia megaterium]|uniref:protein kinase domain-containing protein n=1 Tax=Priestia megaterium TaxID=1404 RepID=UPI000C9CF976|nr:serine/threonine protein kinase [Priestia megaterium]PNE04695.1 serine/threonine protein kinase [Priestia megaterium]
MNNTLKNQVCNLSPGTEIQGKWHHVHYKILKKLGIGATGVVYLVQSVNGTLAALKISFSNMSVTAEVNVLKKLSQVKDKVLGPRLLDVDDWSYGSHALSFYVMEYVKGQPLLSFISTRGTEWLQVFASQLLTDLENLHEEGWVFGDLKPENLVVTSNPVKVRWIDVGGTTLQGRSIKEFTDFYDRAHWGLGSRKAEPTYDLFAVSMVLIHAAYGKRINKTDKPAEQLKQFILTTKQLEPFGDVLYQAVTGKYKSAKEMKTEVLSVEKRRGAKSKGTKPQNVRQPSAPRVKVKKKRSHVLETLLLCTSVMLIYILYLFIQVL